MHTGAAESDEAATDGYVAVAGVRDRSTGRVSAEVVADTSARSLVPLVTLRTEARSMVYSDEHNAYRRQTCNRQCVRHRVGEYVDGQAHTIGIESFWAALKRGYHGTLHHVSAWHLDRYVGEFAGRQNTGRGWTWASRCAARRRGWSASGPRTPNS